MIEIEPSAGTHITEACRRAISTANFAKEPVHFEFNGTSVTAQPGDFAEALTEKWTKDSEAKRKAYHESPEFKADEKRRAEEYQKRCDAILTETALTEEEMRETKSPWPYTKQQLMEYIDSLIENRTHDHGTSVYAASLAATAAFNYIALKLEMTRLQSLHADLDFIRRSCSIRGPFIIRETEDELFPPSIGNRK